MSQKHGTLVAFASVFGLIQSALWMCSGLACCLIYFCVIPVAPYKGDSDFFRVTLVKLYFEGPQCILNGSYLGEFNKDYRTVFNLLTPDKVCSAMTAFIILNAFYFVFSILLFTNRKKENRGVTLGWSTITLILCALDAGFLAGMIHDAFSFRNYMKGSEKLDIYTSSARGILNEITYIPLILALVSSRFIVCWLWNFAVGVLLFFDELCCRKITGKPSKPDKRVANERNGILEEFRQETEDRTASFSVRNGKYYNAFDTRSHPNYVNFDKSLESVTSFRASINNESTIENKTANKDYESSKSHCSKELQMTNEGYVNDDGKCESFAKTTEKQFDFDQNVEKLEKENKSDREPPIGKQVSIPVAPHLTYSESYNC